MMKIAYPLVIVALVLVIVFLLVRTKLDDAPLTTTSSQTEVSSTAPKRPTPVVSDAPKVSPDPPSTEPVDSSLVALIVDELTGRPLPDVSLYRTQPGGEASLVGISNAAGTANGLSLESDESLSFECEFRSGYSVERVNVAEMQIARTDAGIRVSIPYLAVLSVEVQGDDDLVRSAQLRLIARPPLPAEENLDADSMVQLRNKRTSPNKFLEAVRGLGFHGAESHGPLDVDAKTETLIHLPYSGEIIVTLRGEGIISEARSIEVTRGSITNILLVATKRPVVRGRVIDQDGRAVPFAPIRVSSLGYYQDLTSLEETFGASVVTTFKNRPGTEVVLVNSGSADGNGEFSIAPRQLGEVGVATTPPGYTRATASETIEAGSNKTIELRVRAVKPGDLVMQVVFEGAPVTAYSFGICQFEPLDKFNMQFPEFASNDDGLIDVAHLVPGHGYMLLPRMGENNEDRGMLGTPFHCSPGGVIRMKRK